MMNKKNIKRAPKRSTIGRKSYTTKDMTEYLLPNHSLPQGNALDDVLLPYRMYDKNMAKIIRVHRLAINLENKYKIAYAELRSRLHVDEPTDYILAITDIDSGFFLYLSSCLNTKIPLYKSLTFLYNKQFHINQEIGYRHDDVLNRETDQRNQSIKYQNSEQNYMKQVKQFDEFISEDYEKTIMCLKNSETLYPPLIEAKILELNHFAGRQFSIQSKLIEIDHLYHQQQKYGRFLYYVSPPSWRANHKDFARSVEIEAKGFDLGTSSDEDTFQEVFRNMKIECASGFIKPALYFSHHDDLLKIFESVEKQELHHFMHVYQYPRRKFFDKTIRFLKRGIRKDSALLDKIIANIEQKLDFDEERASQLEAKFMKILHGMFYDTVAATDVIQLQVHLEWCFEKVFREKSNTTMGATAKALENMYMTCSYKLENIGNEETKAALKQSILDEKLKMKKAYTAARELYQFDRLEKSLMRTHVNNYVVLPPLPVITRPRIRYSDISQTTPAGRRSDHRKLTKGEVEHLNLFTNWSDKEIKDYVKCLKKPQNKPSIIPITHKNVRQITEEEIEYLRLFTDWSEEEDPANYLKAEQTIPVTRQSDQRQFSENEIKDLKPRLKKNTMPKISQVSKIL